MIEKSGDLAQKFIDSLWKDGFVYDDTVILIGDKCKHRAELLMHKFLCLLEEMADDERRFIEFLSLIDK